MKKRTFVIFSTYVFTKTLLGLTFHPFMQTRAIVQRPILFPVIFSPLIGLGILFVVGRLGAFLVSFYGFDREVLAFFLSSVLLSILMWQALLLYLLGSFLVASLKNK